MKSKQSYTFEHEGVQTAPTKIPKFKVKYAKKQKPTSTSVGEGQTLGEAPANVYSMTTYSPLTRQIDLPASVGLPSLISPSSFSTVSSLSSAAQDRLMQQLNVSQDLGEISPIPENIQQILNETNAYENLQNQIANARTWNGEAIPVFQRPNRPPPIRTTPSPRTRPPPGFYYESPLTESSLWPGGTSSGSSHMSVDVA